MFSLAVDISLLRSEVVSITHTSYKHLTTPRSGPGQRSSTHYYPTTVCSEKGSVAISTLRSLCVLCASAV